MQIFQQKHVLIPVHRGAVHASVYTPANTDALIVCAHEHSRLSVDVPQAVLTRLFLFSGYTTVVCDTPFPSDMSFIAHTVESITLWVAAQPILKHLSVGYFVSNSVAAAALMVAARPEAREQLHVRAIVSFDGRLGLALEAVPFVQAPSLSVVWERHRDLVEENAMAIERMSIAARLKVIPGMKHFFRDPAGMEEAVQATTEWFRHYI